MRKKNALRSLNKLGRLRHQLDQAEAAIERWERKWSTAFKRWQAAKKDIARIKRAQEREIASITAKRDATKRLKAGPTNEPGKE